MLEHEAIFMEQLSTERFKIFSEINKYESLQDWWLDHVAFPTLKKKALEFLGILAVACGAMYTHDLLAIVLTIMIAGSFIYRTFSAMREEYTVAALFLCIGHAYTLAQSQAQKKADNEATS